MPENGTQISIYSDDERHGLEQRLDQGKVKKLLGDDNMAIVEKVNGVVDSILLMAGKASGMIIRLCMTIFLNPSEMHYQLSTSDHQSSTQVSDNVQPVAGIIQAIIMGWKESNFIKDKSKR